MKKLSLKQIEMISGASGRNSGFSCYMAGLGLFTGGLGTILAVPYAINCWNS